DDRCAGCGGLIRFVALKGTPSMLISHRKQCSEIEGYSHSLTHSLSLFLSLSLSLLLSLSPSLSLSFSISLFHTHSLTYTELSNLPLYHIHYALIPLQLCFQR